MKVIAIITVALLLVISASNCEAQECRYTQRNGCSKWASYIKTNGLTLFRRFLCDSDDHGHRLNIIDFKQSVARFYRDQRSSEYSYLIETCSDYQVKIVLSFSYICLSSIAYVCQAKSWTYYIIAMYLYWIASYSQMKVYSYRPWDLEVQYLGTSLCWCVYNSYTIVIYLSVVIIG